MKRCRVRHLDYFVDGNVLIPALLLTFQEMSNLLDAAYDGKIVFVTKRRKGA